MNNFKIDFEDTCAAGTCEYRADGTQFCRCPNGRYGDRCQLLESEDIIESIQFNGATSYIVLPKSKTLRNFSVCFHFLLLKQDFN